LETIISRRTVIIVGFCQAQPQFNLSIDFYSHPPAWRPPAGHSSGLVVKKLEISTIEMTSNNLMEDTSIFQQNGR
jgi:hypothetical protein